MENTVIDFITNLVIILSTVVGAASLIVAGLEQIANLTPTDKDNRAIGKAKRFLATVIALLDRIAINPDKTKAREPSNK